MNIAVVGGGTRCRRLMEVVEQHTFQEIQPKIVAVADINDLAPGICKARDQGLFVTRNYNDLFDLENGLLIFPQDFPFPFKDVEVSDRFAGGLIKAGAGLLGETLDYLKISKKNKLNGNEIKNLISGRSIIATSSGYEWQISFTEYGKATQQTSWYSASGTYWIEGDQLWTQWKYMLEGLKGSRDIYRNPGGTAEMRNEYLYITDWGIHPFSLMEKKD